MKASMEAWGAWFGEHKDIMLDMGGPLGPDGMTVTPEGTKAIGKDMWPEKGYSFITAEDMEAAIKIAQSCPLMSEDQGPQMRVYEVLSM
jgi:hypothetical protein